jgi:hypothetical protein
VRHILALALSAGVRISLMESFHYLSMRALSVVTFAEQIKMIYQVNCNTYIYSSRNQAPRWQANN